MELAEPPHFDGKKWKCACGATLATVCDDEHPEYDPEAAETHYITKVMHKALELPLGYYIKDGVWLKPGKVLGLSRGASGRAARKNRRQEKQEEIQRAARKGDFTSEVMAKWHLRDMDTQRQAPSMSQAQASAKQNKPTRFINSQLPIRVQCSHEHCKRVWLLKQIRRLVDGV